MTEKVKEDAKEEVEEVEDVVDMDEFLEEVDQRET